MIKARDIDLERRAVETAYGELGYFVVWWLKDIDPGVTFSADYEWSPEVTLNESLIGWPWVVIGNASLEETWKWGIRICELVPYFKPTRFVKSLERAVGYWIKIEVKD